MLDDMAVRKKAQNQAEIKDHDKLAAIGRIIKQHRQDLVDLTPPTRVGFISAGWDMGLPIGWISEKSLANIENGYNLPSLTTLYNIAIACQIDPETLFMEVAQTLSSFNRPTDKPIANTTAKRIA